MADIVYGMPKIVKLPGAKDRKPLVVELIARISERHGRPEKEPTAAYRFGFERAIFNAPYPPIDNPAMNLSSLFEEARNVTQ